MKTSSLLLFAGFLIVATLTVAHAADVDEIIVEALIDGDSEFHVRPDSVWWESGRVAKPGKWSGQDEPTYINGTAWRPRWRDQGSKSGDKSAPHPIGLKTTD